MYTVSFSIISRQGSSVQIFLIDKDKMFFN